VKDINVIPQDMLWSVTIPFKNLIKLFPLYPLSPVEPIPSSLASSSTSPDRTTHEVCAVIRSGPVWTCSFCVYKGGGGSTIGHLALPTKWEVPAQH
jgi:hypothetical protein